MIHHLITLMPLYLDYQECSVCNKTYINYPYPTLIAKVQDVFLHRCFLEYMILR